VGQVVVNGFLQGDRVLNGILIDLTTEEKELALKEAHRRHFQSKNLKQTPRNGGPAQDQKGLEIDIAGALGEMAAAKFLEQKQFVFTFNKNWGVYDLPPNIDVKTALGHYRRLRVFLDENPKKLFVHVTYKYEQLRIHGWAIGADVMKEQFIEDPVGRRAAYFVPNSELKPMLELKSILSDLRIK
jgi:hypothetical protein